MKRPLMGMGIALVAGVAAGLMDIPWVGMVLITAVMIVFMILWTDSSYKYVLGLSVLFIVGFCRTLAYDMDDFSMDREIRGTIYRVQEKEKCTYLYIKSEDDLSILVVVMEEDSDANTYYKGQICQVSGETERFSLPANPGQFDERAYYYSQGVSYRIWAKSVKILSEGEWLEQKLRCLETLKKGMSRVYFQSMDEKNAGVLQAAVLGDRSGFQEDLRRYYQENGWMHLVTTSGLHLSFIAMGMYRRMRHWTVPPVMSTVMAFMLMMAYGYMTDYGDSMLRAMGMMVITMIGWLLGRKSDPLTSLVVVADVMIWLRPARLMSSGFLLSYGAVVGVELGKWLGKMQTFGKKDEKKGRFQKSLWVQTGIFIVTLPILLWYMYEIPLFGFIYNFFMIPLVSLIVPLGFAAGVIGAFELPVFKYGAFVMLKIIDKILCAVHKLPAKALVCGQPALWQVILFIAVIFVGVFFLSRKMKTTGHILMLVCCLFLLFVRVRTDQMIFMDVGQGDGICIFTKKGQVIFVDGGSSDIKNVYTYRIEPMLKYYGADQIDGWFLTHGDRDHVSGIEEALAKNVSVKQLFIPDVFEDEVLSDIQRKAKEQSIEIKRIYPGNKITAGAYTLTCLYPGAEAGGDDKNNNSLVLEAVWQDQTKEIRVLLTGDLEEAGENILMTQSRLETVDILKVAHHGSSGATSECFLNAIQPVWAVISCGENNRYGHPHKETLERLERQGCQWLTTSGQGAICIEFAQEGYTIYGYQKKD